jgi:hypothetical protein
MVEAHIAPVPDSRRRYALAGDDEQIGAIGRRGPSWGWLGPFQRDDGGGEHADSPNSGTGRGTVTRIRSSVSPLSSLPSDEFDGCGAGRADTVWALAHFFGDGGLGADEAVVLD